MMRAFTCLLITFLPSASFAWSSSPLSRHGPKVQHNILHEASSSAFDDEGKEASLFEARRNFLAAGVMQLCLWGGSAPSMAAATSTEPTIYRSGNAPVVAGQKPKDKNDVKGTKRDPDFLRSIADCRAQCQNTAGPDGLSKSKEDCLSECQDICCNTYEQCTFAIVPRI